jgi:predicted Zn-dependent peptidase
VVLGMESTGARMSRLGASLLNGLPILSVDEMIEQIDSVEIDAVRALAAELFTPSRMSAAGVGPAETEFLAAIEPLGAAARAPGAAR